MPKEEKTIPRGLEKEGGMQNKVGRDVVEESQLNSCTLRLNPREGTVTDLHRWQFSYLSSQNDSENKKDRYHK